jgi:ABC-type lipoprotein export system ATPase subunit
MSQTIEPARAAEPSSRTITPILLARGVSRSFRMGDSTVRVLDDADIAVMPGEFVAIEGRSGSGKSTMLHILGALDAVDAGQVEFNGRTYTRFTPAEQGPAVRIATNQWVLRAGIIGLVGFAIGAALAAPFGGPAGWLIAAGVLATCLLLANLGTRAVLLLAQFSGERAAARIRNRDFGFVFQFYHLLPEMNVVENTLLGPMIEHSWLSFFSQRRTLRARAIEVLTQLGMEHRLTHRPNQLSGGERQRVAIARALMNQPKVLFADEPTGNLDADTGRQIMGVLERLHREKGQTIIMVTHDRSLARKADRVLVMKQGKLEPAEG